MLFLIKSHFSLSKVSRIHSEIKGGGSVTVLAKINGGNFSLHLSLPQLVLRPMGISNTFLSNWNFQIESIQWMRFSFIVLIQFGWTLGKYSALSNKRTVWNNRAGYYIGLFGYYIKNYFLFNNFFWKNPKKK